MPTAVVEYGLTEMEHKALPAKWQLPLVPYPGCPACEDRMRSKGLVFLKSIEASIRLARCCNPRCRTVVRLWPSWAAIGCHASLAQVEVVVEVREAQGSWREAATAAELEHRPRKLREWVRRVDAVMMSLVVVVAGLMPAGGGLWMAQLHVILAMPGPGVFLALRKWLWVEHGLVLGPVVLRSYGRRSGRSPPSP